MGARSLSSSVVICTLNRPVEIQRCASSIALQSRKPQQVIVVDAGDLGPAKQRVKEICDQAGIEFVYCQDQPSTTRQRNRGAMLAEGEILFFLDDDVELDPDYIAEIVDLYELDQSGKLGGASGVLIPGPSPSSSFWKVFAWLFMLAETRRDVGTRLKPSHFPVHATGLTGPRYSEILPSTAVSYRAGVFKRYLFDVHLTGYVMAEDIDLSYRVSRAYKLVLTPDATFGHSKSPVSRNSPREHEKRRLLFTQYFFQKNLGDSRWRHLARYWSLLGLGMRYFYLGLRQRDMQRLLGLYDGLRAARRNRLLTHRHFVAGPLQY
jgi:GT2 family glycosyltransferase